MRPPPQSATDSKITRRIGKKTPRSANPLQFSESGGGRRMPGKSGGRPKKAGRGCRGYSWMRATTSPYSVSSTGTKPTRVKNCSGPPWPAS